MKSKMSVFKVLAFSIITFMIAPAARSADWGTTVGGVTFECNVDRSSIDRRLFGTWHAFAATLSFCQGKWNPVYKCEQKGFFSNKYDCKFLPTPEVYVPCGSKSIKADGLEKEITLNSGDSNAYGTVCTELFGTGFTRYVCEGGRCE